MKFLETHFEEYINEVCKLNLHPKLEKLYNDFPKLLDDFGNIIMYGPSGIGKYSQMLYAIKQYSPSNLKYEKKISVMYDKEEYFFKISDIHFEIDMSLLGCNAKLLWHDIYQYIVDILLLKNNKTGIIVCKNFHCIQNELLENFYSYMQCNNILSINIKYILLTESVSFIPDTIINCSEIINITRPSKSAYAKCSKSKIQSKLNIENIANIKYLHTEMYDLMCPNKIICNKIIKEMINVDKLKFLKFRDILYDIFIYNLDTTECIWYILTNLIKEKKIKEKNISKIMIKLFNFLKY